MLGQMTLTRSVLGMERSDVPGLIGDWLKVAEELVRRHSLNVFFSGWKANEGEHLRRILLLGNTKTLEPAIDICPRSARQDGKGIEHASHTHHPTLSSSNGVPAIASCQIDKPGRVVEYFSADREHLFSEPPVWSCTEPDWPRLRSEIRRRGWVDD